MIVGNEEAVIERCLDAFAPAFDELCIVRAVGNQTPDQTIERARQWCRRHERLFFADEYTNDPECAGWPHVDDFGAARNRAFDLAMSDWVFWADADDIVKPGCRFERLRELVAAVNAPDVLLCPYDVPGTHKAPLRERVFRRSIRPRWTFPVHENVLLGPEIRTAPAFELVWLHAPLSAKPRSTGRNLAILQHAIRHTATQLYYIHQEHYYAGHRDESKRWGEITARMPGLHPSFAYELQNNLGKTAPSAVEAMENFARAHSILPHCREAIAGMATAALEQGDLVRAETLTEQLIRLPEPPLDRRPWTHELKWYKWAAIDLRARVLRLMHRIAEADQLVAESFGKPVISLIHATRGRNQRAWQCRDHWLSAASDATRIEHIMCVDQDDPDGIGFARQFVHTITPPGGGCVAAWNAGAHVAVGQVLVQLSDDWMPCYGWDTLLLEAIGSDLTRPRVVAVSDGHRTDDLLCMAICTRQRWEQQGRELFSGEYLSMYSDNEFSYRAWSDGVVIDARDRIQFAHLHPAFGQGAWDATYARSNDPQRYATGRATFLHRNPDADPQKWAPLPCVEPPLQSAHS